MNPLLQLTKMIALFVTALVLVCFGLVPPARAVVPPPDGGYPNFTTAEGTNALKNLSSGAGNTGVGWSSLFTNTTTSFNTAIGAGTLLFNNADFNTAVGTAALLLNTDGTQNTASGIQALYSNTTGQRNTANGAFALFSNITGSNNTATGRDALLDNTIGGSNTAIGHLAGSDITGNGNVCIGASVFGTAGVDNTTWIGNVYDSVATDRAVFVNSDGKLGTMASSRRFKEQIKPMDKASEAILALKPVTFRYKQEIDSTRTPQFGLVAEDVAKVHPDLVVRDEKGEIYSVRYEAVNVMLLNEFLQAHHKVEAQQSRIEQQEATIAQLKKDFQMVSAEQRKEIQVLSAQLKDQATQMQKVSAQIELSKFATGRICRGGPSPQTVLNNQ
jgi:hypothetical protein